MLTPQLIRLSLHSIAIALTMLITPTSAQPQSELLGHHTINLRLKPMPAAQVLSILSARSHAIAQLKDAPADEGRPWSVEGASLLEGIAVKVEFVETPVYEAVSRLLGCIGFGYEEQDNHIRIVAANTWTADRCSGLQRVATTEGQAVAARDPTKTYSWSYASISAFDFVRRWSMDTDRSVVVPNRENEEFKKIMLEVQLSNVTPRDALQALARCTGYVVETRDDTLVVTTSGHVEPKTCRGFKVIGAQ